MLFLVNRAGVPSVAKWVHLTGGRKPSHEPAMIKELIDMRLTGKEIPVPGTEFMDRPPQLTEKLQATEKKATVSKPAPGKKKNERENAARLNQRGSPIP